MMLQMVAQVRETAKDSSKNVLKVEYRNNARKELESTKKMWNDMKRALNKEKDKGKKASDDFFAFV